MNPYFARLDAHRQEVLISGVTGGEHSPERGIGSPWPRNFNVFLPE
jgi:hypothetical protein